MPLPLSPFRRAAAEAVAGALGVAADSLPVSTPPDAALGDYSVGCFPAARELRANPAALAQKAAAAIVPGGLVAGAQAAGPYVNLRLDRGALYRHLFDATLGQGTLIPQVGAGKTVWVDLSSPNIAKHLAYHHIRSAVIGKALVNLHRALGYHVIGINHLGDWGTTFGMLLAACHRWGTPEPLTVEALNQLYVRFNTEAKADPATATEGRAFFQRLESGEPELRALWTRIKSVSLAEYQEVYDLLSIKFDEVRGESEYLGDVPRTIALLEEKGLASISDGALVVDLSAEGMPPLILRKSDGTTIYATRDLASAIRRWERAPFARSLYVVDKGQGLHFKQLITTLKKAGLPWADRVEHVPFGLVRLGGKKARTRTGEVILLRKVIEEAASRVRKLLEETNPDLPPARAAEVAHEVGTGAVVFANLVAQREKDVDFEWEEIVSLRGDAGPYIQYAHARTASLLRSGGRTDLASADPAPLARDEEFALARLLTELGDEVARAADADEPHVMARYLLDVCAAFSRWYTLGNQDPSLKVIVAAEATSRARLALAAATQRVLATGLGLLGLAAPDSMYVRWLLFALFALTYVGISARRLHVLPIGRPAVALVGACALVVVGALAGERGLTLEEALRAVEMHTLVLLFAMMVVAAGLAQAGFFAWAARRLAARTRSHAALLWAVTLGSGLLSAVLVNDAVCLLATPLLVRVAAQLGAEQRPLLFGIAMGANAGSALTLSGNPQNMLVARLGGLSYRGYLGEAALPALAAMVATAAVLHLLFRRELRAMAPVGHEVSEEPKLDRPLLAVSLAALVGIVVANLAGANLAGAALVGAAVVLCAARLNAEALLQKVDWTVLLFFAALFVVVAALQKTGLPGEWLAAAGGGAASLPVLVAVLVVGSQVVSNVPLILLLQPWIAGHPNAETAWTVTAVATTLAGNLTLLGSVANIIVLEKARAQVGFFEYLRVGVVVTGVSLGVAMLLLVGLSG